MLRNEKAVVRGVPDRIPVSNAPIPNLKHGCFDFDLRLRSLNPENYPFGVEIAQITVE
jgi:hypothetical protein